MLSYEDLFEALYGKDVNERELRHAREEVAAMSDEEWHDWIEYRQSRLWARVPL